MNKAKLLSIVCYSSSKFGLLSNFQYTHHTHTHTQLRYKFANGQDSIDTNTFRVDSVTGVIFLIATIDFETTMEYTFVVEASDISSAPLTASVDVM